MPFHQVRKYLVVYVYDSTLVRTITQLQTNQTSQWKWPVAIYLISPTFVLLGYGAHCHTSKNNSREA